MAPRPCYLLRDTDGRIHVPVLGRWMFASSGPAERAAKHASARAGRVLTAAPLPIRFVTASIPAPPAASDPA